jgi:ParB family chromosome partitioning protein
LLALVDPEQQIKLAHRVVTDGLNVRETERLARASRVTGISEPQTPGREAAEPRIHAPLDPDLADFAERLQRRLGTKVELRPGAEGGGSIVIRWYDDEDLLRIAEVLDA